MAFPGQSILETKPYIKFSCFDEHISDTLSVAWPCHYGLVKFYDPVYPAEEVWFSPETGSPAYSRTFDQNWS